MRIERSVTAIAVVLTFSSAVVLGGLLFSPIFDDEAMDGDWYLSWSNGRDSDGKFVSDVFALSSLLSITESSGGVINGKMGETVFTGAVNDSILRASLNIADGHSAEMLGTLSTPDVLNIVAVTYNSNTDTAGSYSLLFTRDSAVPHMIDEIQQKITGNWITGQISSSEDIRDVKMNVTSQDSAISCGTIEYDGDSTAFCLSISMITNNTMNAGLMIDGNGTFWMILLKKGLIAMHSASAYGNAIDSSNVYLIRDFGNIFIHSPVDLSTGSMWNGEIGHDLNGSEPIDGYSLEITEQKDCTISGKIIGGSGDCVFVGVFFASEPAAELTILIGTDELHATMFVIKNTITIVAFGGDTLFEGLESMTFGK